MHVNKTLLSFWFMAASKKVGFSAKDETENDRVVKMVNAADIVYNGQAHQMALKVNYTVGCNSTETTRSYDLPCQSWT